MHDVQARVWQWRMPFLAPAAQSSTWSQHGSFKSSIPQNAAGVSAVFENAVCTGGSRVRQMGNSLDTITQSSVCLVNHCPDCLYNTIGEFQVLARTYLQSPGQSQDISRNALNCVFGLLGFFKSLLYLFWSIRSLVSRAINIMQRSAWGCFLYRHIQTM